MKIVPDKLVEAVSLLQRTLLPGDRVLILGASGWFGQTLSRLLDFTGHEQMLLGSSRRTLQRSREAKLITTWDETMVKSFEPTIVCDFAFLTREFASRMTLEDYELSNTRLIEQGLAAYDLPSVRMAIAVSSGAVHFPSSELVQKFGFDPYTRLKAESESQYLLAAAKSGKALGILRPFSVSGDLVTKPRGFALSDFICQAIETQKIVVKSSRPVLRRFVAVDDLLALGFQHASNGSDDPVLESGGELIDLLELAKKVKSAVGGKLEIVENIDSTLEPDDYYSRSHVWEDACQRLHYKARDLDQQITDVLKAFA